MEKRKPRLLSGKGSSGNKKIIIYAVIGIVAVAVVAFAVGAQEEEEEDEGIALARIQFCGLDSQANSNAFVSERVLPSECEMPLGITVDSEKVWYLSTKQGKLVSYSPASGNFEEFQIPSWPLRSNPDPRLVSMAWGAGIDDAGNIWFTDDRQNLLWRFETETGNFDSFQSPAIGPISFDFDANGNMYLVGIRSNSLYIGNISEMRPGTMEGFREIRLPLDGFGDINPSNILSGSVAVDRERDVAWVSLLVFQLKGQLFRYDTAANEVFVYDLPSSLQSPVGTTVDREGNLWVTDHGTSMFFMLDPDDRSLTRYVTSILSPRITGPSPPPASAYTLPYWIQTDSDGNIWFNQHVGNKITKFDPSTQTMTEYWIPTQNQRMGNIANALQFAVGPENQVWFTEWTENKIGTVRTDAEVPFSVSAPDEITVNRGDSVDIRVQVHSTSNLDLRMVHSGTFTSTGNLGSSTGIFSQQTVSVEPGSSRQISYVFTPAESLAPGQYTLMLGADQGDVTVLKAVRLHVA